MATRHHSTAGACGVMGMVLYLWPCHDAVPMLMVWLMLKKTAHVLDWAHSGHTACTWGPMPDT